MERPGLFERQRIQAVVEKGRMYASERPSLCAPLRARIRRAEIASAENLGATFRVDPPSARSPRGRIAYDPNLVARLLADHTYPEWVIAAQLEILIAHHTEEWHAGTGCETAPGAGASDQFAA
jgi:hypothetical protein